MVPSEGVPLVQRSHGPNRLIVTFDCGRNCLAILFQEFSGDKCVAISLRKVDLVNLGFTVVAHARRLNSKH
jgi:hypothetical protein